MRQTMTAEVRLEGKINKSRHREAANRSFRPPRGPHPAHTCCLGSPPRRIIALTIREFGKCRFIDEPTGPSFLRRAAGPVYSNRLGRAHSCRRYPDLRAVHARRCATSYGGWSTAISPGLLLRL